MNPYFYQVEQVENTGSMIKKIQPIQD